MGRKREAEYILDDAFKLVCVAALVPPNHEEPGGSRRPRVGGGPDTAAGNP